MRFPPVRRRKRLLDLALSAVGVGIFSPVMLAAAVAVVVDDGLPILFHQARVGRHRRPFVIAKLRSMRGGRVTRAGGWLRHSGLDEVMQFWNVLRGDMSVVGPRPLTDDDVKAFGWAGADMDWRFQAVPGITGLAQVVGGRTLGHSWRLEQLYLKRQSASLDLALVGASFVANVVGKKRMGEGVAWVRALGRRRRRRRRNRRAADGERSP